ncbi:MAG: ribonuclease P protein component [Chthoniobacterales bacterium]
MAGESHRLRFGKSRRLQRSADFTRVRTEGESHRGSFLLVGVLAPADQPQSVSVGFVTSKRIGGAVTRNKVRRRLREIVRKHQHDLRSGIWLVVVARPRAAGATYSALEQEWLRLAKRASILAP